MKSPKNDTFSRKAQRPQRPPGSPPAGRRAAVLPVLPIYFFLSVALLLVGYFFFAGQRRRIESQKLIELSAIADLKAAQISAWRGERRADAMSIYRNADISQLVRRIETYSETSRTVEKTKMWMASLYGGGQYSSIQVFDLNGHPLVGIPEGNIPESGSHRTTVSHATESTLPVISDLELLPRGSVQMEIVVPIKDTTRPAGRLLGICALTIDPSRILYPLLKSWPIPSWSAEALLVEAEGDSVVFLNDLRHRSGAALRLKLSRADTTVVAVRAANGVTGILQGRDYRGEEVLAVVHPVAGTPWLLVVKEDRAELFTDVGRTAAFTFIVVLLLIGAAGLVTYILWKRRLGEQELARREAELKNLTLAERYDYLAKYANDVIILWAEDQTVLQVNDRVRDVYGYTPEEIVGNSVSILRPPELRADLPKEMRRLREAGGGTYETTHRRKDGTIFPVEVSTRFIDAVDRPCFQSIIRDISDWKKAQEELERSERQFRSAFELSGVGMAHIALDGRFLRVNQRYCDVTGRTPEDLLRRKVSDVTVPDDLRKEIEQDDRILNGECRDYTLEKRIVRPDGGEVWVESNVGLVRNLEGVPAYWVNVIGDISDRKKAEERVLKLNRIYAVLSNVNEAIVRARSREELFGSLCRIAVEAGEFRLACVGVFDKSDGSVRVVAQSSEEGEKESPIRLTMNGEREGGALTDRVFRTRSHAVSQDIAADEQFGPWRAEALRRGLRSSTALPILVNGDVYGTFNLYSAQRDFFNEEELHLLDEMAGDISYALEFFSKQEFEESARAELRSGEERLKTLFRAVESSEEVILITDPDGTITYCNPSVEKVYGYRREEVIGKNPRMFKSDRMPAEFYGTLWAMLTAGKSVRQEFVNKTRSGSFVIVDQTISPMFREGGERGGYIGVQLDVTERKRGDQALKESEEKFRRLFEENLAGNYVARTDGALAACNPAFAKIFGFESVENAVQETLVNLFDTPGEFQTFVTSVRSGRKVENREMRLRRKDGTHVYVIQTAIGQYDTAGELVQIQGYVIDITSHKNLEQQLQQAQKMESLGTLAGGIAHDFNNILAIIMGYAGLIGHQRNDTPKFDKSLDMLNAAVQRGADLVRQILTFARKTDIGAAPVMVNTLIRELSALLSETFPKTITIQSDLGKTLPAVLGDKTQIHQALLNLAVNARDAMPTGGTLRFRTSLVDGKQVVERFPLLAAHEFLRIDVEDTGTGIPAEAKEKIFDPFFTTKGHEKGTGLGLSVVYGIVTGHKGAIDVQDRSGGGTVFSIFLPTSDTVEEDLSTGEEKAADTLRGSETVLLVEDEDALRYLSSTILQSSGYHVIETADGMTGLERYRALAAGIDIVLVDVGLPRLGGVEAVREMKNENPDVPVLMMSGRVDPEVRSELHKVGVEDILAKPFRRQDLLRRIREILDRSKSNGTH